MRKLNIEILPPHVNSSDIYFSVKDGNIIFGFLGIKGIGEQAAITIVKDREANGDYKSFIDFLDRVDLHIVTKKTLESLINTGCFDGLGETRATLITNMEKAVSFSNQKKEGQDVGQISLFSDTGITEFSNFNFERCEEYPKKELLRLEKEFIGSYVSGHPLDIYKDKIEEYATLETVHLNRATEGKDYLMMGSISSIKTYEAKKGQMCFANLEDLTGHVDLVFFSDVWANLKSSLFADGVYGVEGKVSKKEKDDGVEYSFIVKNIINVKEFKDVVKQKEKIFSEVHIEITPTENVEALQSVKNYVTKHKGDANFFIHFEKDSSSYIVKAKENLKIAGKKDTIDDILEIPCVLNAWGE